MARDNNMMREQPGRPPALFWIVSTWIVSTKGPADSAQRGSFATSDNRAPTIDNVRQSHSDSWPSRIFLQLRFLSP